MRLLLDENISWRLGPKLLPYFGEVVHVRDIGLNDSPDTSIWRYARQHGYDILTKDADFTHLVVAEGFPPRVVVVQNAQVGVAVLAEFIVLQMPRVKLFLGEQADFGMMILRLT